MMEAWSPPDHLQVDEDDFSSLETRLPFDPHDLEIQMGENTPQTYKRLSTTQRKKFERSLDRNEKGDNKQVIDRLISWKNPKEYDAKTAQTHERLVKKTLDVPVEVRSGGQKADSPSSGEIYTLKKLYIATQCFIDVHFSEMDKKATKNL
jgi:hypothetical protein